MIAALRWPPTALIVDDDPGTVEILARLFRLEGYNVLTAANGERGLQEATRSRPDVIILDLRMPILDGLSFLRLFRVRDHRNTPVAIVTGDTMLDDAIMAELHHFGASVRFKPIWLGDLVELAGGLLESAARPESDQNSAPSTFLKSQIPS
jgi:DNA-binding response OmpR family regulator